jgi:RNA polymerase sigma-70 factor, ECF subfamily
MDAQDQAGDERRFTALFRQHVSALDAFARRRVGSDAAQEVVAETFLVAWRRLEDVPDQALPWLYRVASYEIANLRRRQQKTARLERALLAAPHGVADAGDPVAAADLARAVGAAFASLGERDREVLRLAAWEHLSAKVGAAVLGCSVSAYRMRLHRARTLLAKRSAVSGVYKARGIDQRDARTLPFPTPFLAPGRCGLGGTEEVG